jgi:hypothetical protein
MAGVGSIDFAIMMGGGTIVIVAAASPGCLRDQGPQQVPEGHSSEINELALTKP